jgi:hypothetical protein
MMATMGPTMRMTATPTARCEPSALRHRATVAATTAMTTINRTAISKMDNCNSRLLLHPVPARSEKCVKTGLVCSSVLPPVGQNGTDPTDVECYPGHADPAVATTPAPGDVVTTSSWAHGVAGNRVRILRGLPPTRTIRGRGAPGHPRR